MRSAVQLQLPEFASHLSATLAPIYLISGDDPLLVQEACDDVIAAARQRGFSERTLMHVERGFHWQELAISAASLSLFAKKRLLDLRLASNRFDKAASEVLRRYVQATNPDTLLLIRTGRLEFRQKSSAWFKAIDKAGVVLLLWPVSLRELPGWLQQRLTRAGLEMDRDALRFLAERVEGNLLAAVQEIEKLKLLHLPQPIRLQALRSAVSDSTHYGVFEMIDAALAGQAARTRHMLLTLQQEGSQPLLVLGAVSSQIRRMLNGGYLPAQRKRLLAKTKSRLGPAALQGFLIEASSIDQQIKGMLAGDPWQSIERLLLGLSGLRTTPWLRRSQALLRRH